MSSITKYIILLSTLLMLSLQGCCPADTTPDIRAIMEPMKVNLEVFFKQHHQYPDETQRDILVEKSGCEITDSDNKTCLFREMSFRYESNLELTRGEYFFAIARDNSHCTLYMSTDGDTKPIECIQDFCTPSL